LVTLNFRLRLFESAESLTRYWPTLTDLKPNSAFTVVL
jgi:hypothetical protein